MIDISNEQVVSLRDAAKILPKRRRGKKPHVATLYRWAQRGLRDVHLETIQVGGTLCTSVEALQRFFDRLSGDAVSPAGTSLRDRDRELEQVESRLEKIGI